MKHVLIRGTPPGIRTQTAGVKARYAKPLRQRGMLFCVTIGAEKSAFLCFFTSRCSSPVPDQDQHSVYLVVSCVMKVECCYTFGVAAQNALTASKVYQFKPQFASHVGGMLASAASTAVR